MIRHLLFLFLIFPLLFVFFPALAQGNTPYDNVRLEADFVEYDEVRRVVLAKGHVRLYYQEMVFESERLEYDTNQWLVKTDQPFVIRRNQEELKGTGIQYDLQNHIASSGNTIFIKGRAQLASSELTWKTDYYEAKEVYFTLCNREYKDYHVTASQAFYYPQRQKNNLELLNASLYLGESHIITLPSLTLSLGSKKRKRQVLPTVRYSSQRGYSLNLDYNYWSDEKNEGVVSLEYYSLIGLGGGISHIYDVNDEESFQGVIRYLPDTGLQGGIGYRHIYNTETLEILAMQRDILNSSSLTDYFTFYLITQLPEIQWTGASRSLGDSRLFLDYHASYGNFSESLITRNGPSTPQIVRSRWKLEINLQHQPIFLSPSTQLKLAAREAYNSYSGGEHQSVAYGQWLLSQTLWTGAWFEGGYRYLFQDGLSPFSFDKRDLSNNFLMGAFESPILGDFKLGISYIRDLDRATDTLLNYTVKYETDCIYLGFTYGMISQSWELDFKLAELTD